jgi:phosphoribosylglycinamide formyltransferase-1
VRQGLPDEDDKDKRMKNIAVFASGRGTNFAAIVREVKKGKIKAHLALLLCDQPDAPVLKKAKKFGVKIALVKREGFLTRDAFEEKIIEYLEAEKVDLIVLAGFMRVLGAKLVGAYRNKIINIHPALLPSFKGAQAIKDAFDYGVKITGVTVHFVDELMDHGAIILQQALKIEESDTLVSLEKKIHAIEHKLYPQAINKVISPPR